MENHTGINEIRLEDFAKAEMDSGIELSNPLVRKDLSRVISSLLCLPANNDL